MFGFNVKAITDTLTTVADISASTAITPNADADVVIIQARTQAVNVTVCGTIPTATKGIIIPAGSYAPIGLGNGVSIKVIQAAATATIDWYSFSVRKDVNT